MSKFTFLPGRWRRGGEAARHAEAIRDILDTPPIVPASDGLVLFAEIGTAELLPTLVAVKSLHAQLKRGRVVLLDDGTLTGEDRALLAHHCGDPELIAAAGDEGSAGFLSGKGWKAFCTVLARRQSEYWLWLGSDSVTIAAVPEVERAIALNASCMLPGPGKAEEPQGLGEFVRAHYPAGPADGDAATRIESRLAKVARSDWRYLRGSAGLLGFGAGGPGLRFAASACHVLESLVGASTMRDPGAVQIAANLHLASEKRTVLLPRARYRHDGREAWDEGAAFFRFAEPDRYADGTYASISRVAIEGLLAR